MKPEPLLKSKRIVDYREIPALYPEVYSKDSILSAVGWLKKEIDQADGDAFLILKPAVYRLIEEAFGDMIK